MQNNKYELTDIAHLQYPFLRRIRALRNIGDKEFVTCGIADHYEALKIAVLNRTGGEIDRILLRFKDVLGIKHILDNPNFKEGLAPYIWRYGNETGWYVYQLAAADYSANREAAEKYLKTFREQNRSKLVYICAPLRGDVEANIEFARQKAAELFREGYIPICPHLMFTPVADVNNPAQDEQARQMGLQLIGLCSQVNVYGALWSDGMWAEINQAEWLAEARRIARPGAPVCMFIDWRQLPAASDALQWAGWIWRGTAVWDKGNSRPQRGRFRQQAEYIVWGSNGDMPISRPVPCLPGVFKYGNPSKRIHLTEKPLQLMRDIVQICEPGGLILDPFAGSGTTVLAAVLEGYRAVGIEVTDVYARLAQERIAGELAEAVN